MVSYRKAASEQQSLSLIDKGANGGVAGNDVRVISKTERTVDIHWIDNHQSTNIDIGTNNYDSKRTCHWYHEQLCLA
jgi:hypothetical protein